MFLQKVSFRSTHAYCIIPAASWICHLLLSLIAITNIHNIVCNNVCNNIYNNIWNNICDNVWNNIWNNICHLLLCLREDAMDIFRKLIPAPTLQQRRAALVAAGGYLVARGVTSVGDMGWATFSGGGGSWEDLEEVYMPAADKGEMPVRYCKCRIITDCKHKLLIICSDGSQTRKHAGSDSTCVAAAAADDDDDDDDDNAMHAAAGIFSGFTVVTEINEDDVS
jgi:hypothetical protein